MKKSLFVTGATAAVLSACVASTNWTPQNLAGTLWVDATGAKSAQKPGLEFGNKGQLTGSSGCNRILGHAQWSAEGLNLDPAGLTKMFCDPVSNQVESDFVEALSQTRNARMQDQQLHLLDAQGKVLWRFTPQS